MGGNNQQSTLRIVGLSVAVGAGLLSLVAFSVKLGFGPAAIGLVLGGILTAMILAPIFLIQNRGKKKRMSTIRSQRPQAVLVDGMTPLYMTLPPPATEWERRQPRSRGKAATLAITAGGGAVDVEKLWHPSALDSQLARHQAQHWGRQLRQVQ